MKLLFKQKLFSWFDSYDIYDENGYIVYKVKGQLSWGHCLKISNAQGMGVGMIKERVITFLPKFDIYLGKRNIGCISKEFTLFKPKYKINYNGWHMEGNFLEWDYNIVDAYGNHVAVVKKALFKLTDTYVIDVYYPEDALYVLMLVLAIDAEKCSRDYNVI